MDRRLRGLAPWIVVGHGLLYLALSAAHHAMELAQVSELRGPALAFSLDGGMALVVVALGLWLRRSPVDVDQRFAVAAWTLGGSLLFQAFVGLSMAVKLSEGRPLSEPAFDLLLAGTVGGLAGFVAGYYHVRARQEARQARRSSRAMALVNGLLRHDLRNDLTAVAGTADLLEDGAGEVDAQEVRDQALLIQQKSEEAIELIDETGTMAQTVAGEAPLDRVDLVDVVDQATQGLPGDPTVEEDLPETLPAQANEGLRSVVDNLLENAVQHHDGDPWIRVAAEAEDGTVLLRIADDGPGIPDDRKADLLEPAEGTSEASGLHLVATLVQSFGGSVEVEDREPRGTVVTVRLEAADG